MAKINLGKGLTIEEPNITEKIAAEASIVSTVTYSENDQFGAWERWASYFKGRMAGLTESNMVRLIKAAMHLKENGGQSGPSAEIPGSRKEE